MSIELFGNLFVFNLWVGCQLVLGMAGVRDLELQRFCNERRLVGIGRKHHLKKIAKRIFHLRMFVIFSLGLPIMVVFSSFLLIYSIGAILDNILIPINRRN